MCSTSVEKKQLNVLKNISLICFSIVRAFLIEEQRIVAMVMKSKKAVTTEPAVHAQGAGQKSK
jgi:hypothetical protein